MSLAVLNRMKLLKVGGCALLLSLLGCSGEHGNNTTQQPLEPVAYMEACDLEQNNCEGEGVYCANFNAKGAHCTHDCTAAEDCAAPSQGCNGMGYCKPPVADNEDSGNGDGTGGS